MTVFFYSFCKENDYVNPVAYILVFVMVLGQPSNSSFLWENIKNYDGVCEVFRYCEYYENNETSDIKGKFNGRSAGTISVRHLIKFRVNVAHQIKLISRIPPQEKKTSDMVSGYWHHDCDLQLAQRNGLRLITTYSTVKVNKICACFYFNLKNRIFSQFIIIMMFVYYQQFGESLINEYCPNF